jgi:ADP-ribose pyrophosphatase
LKTILYKGKYLDLICEDHWEYVKRSNCSGIVVIVPMTRDGKVIFVEQFRRPVEAQVIEWPAGLVNDRASHDPETMEAAARRELLEETGYAAEHLLLLAGGPVSSGLSSEIITFYQALNVAKKGPGGGDETESIKVHEVPLKEVDIWLCEMEKKGLLVDPKVYVGLYFLKT